jgi:site-specific recombinase XerD
MQRITVHTILRADREKNGLQPMYVRIITERKKIDIRVPHAVAAVDLLPNGSIKNSVFNSWAINQDLQNILNDVNRVILFHRANNITLTNRSFTELYRKKIDTGHLHKYIRTQAAEMAISSNRLFAFRVLARHIEEHFANVTLADCNYSFLSQLEKVLRNDLHFAENTITAMFSRLRTVITIAAKKKLINDNPFAQYKIKPYTSNRQFLTKSEVLQIEKYYAGKAPEHLKNIAASFLFMCYTGLRVSDFTRLKFEHIKDGSIDFVQAKTKARNFVPLSAPAMRFICADNFTFYITSAKNINAGLKTIATKTKITKPLTCHVARHTFATLSMQLDMNIQSISKILGHSKIATTMIYAKVLDESKKQEIGKWAGFLDLKA